MNITAFFKRLLFTISLVIAAVVVFQSFALNNRILLSLSLPADKGSVVVVVGNATTILNGSKPAKIHAVNVAAEDDYESDLGGEDGYENENDEKESHVGFDLEVGFGGSVDYSSQAYNDEKSFGEVMLKKGVALLSTDESSTVVKSVENGHDHLKQVEEVETSYDLMDNSKGVKSKENLSVDSRISESSFTANISATGNIQPIIEKQPRNLGLPHADSVILNNIPTIKRMPMLKRSKMQPTSISQMNSLLLQSHVSSSSGRPQRSSTRDHELLLARRKIENAPIVRNTPGLYASIFQNVSMFKRSYELMERMLKVYIYREGERPIFHQPYMRGIYASEGWFMKLMEGNKKFVARDPKRAHLFYLPFSATVLRTTLFGQNFHSQKDLEKFLKDYVELIAGKYRFWNRTGGADHFLVACHDWASRVTRNHMSNCIRVLCNANVARGFNIGKDTSLPVTYIKSAQHPLGDLGGKPPSERPILAFFAGSMHGYLRPILLQYWENKEPDMKIFGPMPRDIEGKKIYREYMKSSKYCICARGYEVHTPRVVEAILYECVPVILSDNYVPPFFEVLNWGSFSVFIQEKDIPNLRNILLSIPEEKYLEMQSRVKMVQQHFLWHKPPLKYDLFHMILHSVWYNRVFQVKPTRRCESFALSGCEKEKEVAHAHRKPVSVVNNQQRKTMMRQLHPF